MNERQDIEKAVRASDAERERIAKLVSEAAGEGRLSIEEADDRLERVYTTRFRHELAEFVVDLPAGRPQAPRPPGVSTGSRRGCECTRPSPWFCRWC
jgi:hypothetical protein